MTSPSQKIHVAGSARFEAGASGLGAFVSVGNTSETAGNYSAYYFGNTATDTGYFKGGIAYETLSSTYGRGDMHFLQDSGNNSSNATLADSVMTILNGGNVGIGTDSPSEKLDVNGRVRIGDVNYSYSGQNYHILLAENSQDAYISNVEGYAIMSSGGYYYGANLRQLNSGSTSYSAIQARPCLLYTSPSPRDRTRSRMPSSA